MDSPKFIYEEELLSYTGGDAQDILTSKAQSQKLQTSISQIDEFSPAFGSERIKQVLEEALKREDQLKSQCEELFKKLSISIHEQETSTSKMHKMREREKLLIDQIEFQAKELEKVRKMNGDFNNEELILKLFRAEDTLEAFAMWKKSNFIKLQEISDSDNFSMLREMLVHKEEFSLSPEEQSNLILQLKEKQAENEGLKETLLSREIPSSYLKQNSQHSKLKILQGQLTEKEEDIQQLIDQCKSLENTLQSTLKTRENAEKEVLSLRKRLFSKSQELKAMAVRHSSPEEPLAKSMDSPQLDSLTQGLIEANAMIDYQAAQLKILKSRKPADNIHSEEIQNYLTAEITHQVENCTNGLVLELKNQIERLERDKLYEKLQKDIQRSEINKLTLLLDEERNFKGDINTSNIPELEYLKKMKKEHVGRVEKVYKQQINELTEELRKMTEYTKERETEYIDAHSNSQKEVSEITERLKQEHSSKKVIVEHFIKEKARFHQEIAALARNRDTEDRTLKGSLLRKEGELHTCQSKLEHLQSEMQQSTESLKSRDSLISQLQRRVEGSAYTEQRLYSQLTELNMKIQQLEHTASSQYNGISSELEESNSRLEAQNQEVALLLTRIEELKDEYSLLESHYSAMECENKIKESELTRLKSRAEELAKHKKLLAESQSELEKCRKSNKELLAASNESSQLICKLETQARESAENLAQAESLKVRELQQETQAISASCHTLEQELGRKGSELNSLAQTLSQLLSENSDLQTRLQEANEEKQSHSQLREDLENTIKNLTETIKNTDLFDSVNAKVTFLEDKYESLLTTQDNMMDKIRPLFRQWTEAASLYIELPERIAFTDPTSEALAYFEILTDSSLSLLSHNSELIATARKVLSSPDIPLTTTHILQLAADNLELYQSLLDNELEFKELTHLSAHGDVTEWTLNKIKKEKQEKIRLREELIALKAGNTEELEDKLSRAAHQIVDLQQLVAELQEQKQLLQDSTLLLWGQVPPALKSQIPLEPTPSAVIQWLLETFTSGSIEKKLKSSKRWQHENKKLLVKLEASQKETRGLQCLSDSYKESLEGLKQRVNHLDQELSNPENNSLANENKYLQDLVREYKQSKEELSVKLHCLKLKYPENFLQEETKVRQSLESELIGKCELVEELRKELEGRRKFFSQ